MTELGKFIRVYDNVLAPDFCDHMVERFEADSEHQTGPGGIPVGTSHADAESKWTELNLQNLDSWNDVTEKLTEQVIDYAVRYANDCDIALPPKCALEEFRIKRYMPGMGDQFRPHVDADSIIKSRRFLVFFWYLSDVAEGGETYFTELDIGVKPAKGRLILFPPYWMYPHAGLPPKSGVKYILGTYLIFSE
jgi:hypothetical protein